MPITTSSAALLLFLRLLILSVGTAAANHTSVGRSLAEVVHLLGGTANLTADASQMTTADLADDLKFVKYVGRGAINTCFLGTHPLLPSWTLAVKVTFGRKHLQTMAFEHKLLTILNTAPRSPSFPQSVLVPRVDAEVFVRRIAEQGVLPEDDPFVRGVSERVEKGVPDAKSAAILVTNFLVSEPHPSAKDLDLFAAYIRATLRALAHARARGVGICDIKEDNVLWDAGTATAAFPDVNRGFFTHQRAYEPWDWDSKCVLKNGKRYRGDMHSFGILVNKHLMIACREWKTCMPREDQQLWQRLELEQQTAATANETALAALRARIGAALPDQYRELASLAQALLMAEDGRPRAAELLGHPFLARPGYPAGFTNAEILAEDRRRAREKAI